MPATQNKEGKRGPSPSEAGATEQSEVVGDTDDEIHPRLERQGRIVPITGLGMEETEEQRKKLIMTGTERRGREKKKKASSLASLLILTVALVCQGP